MLLQPKPKGAATRPGPSPGGRRSRSSGQGAGGGVAAVGLVGAEGADQVVVAAAVPAVAPGRQAVLLVDAIVLPDGARRRGGAQHSGTPLWLSFA